MKKAEKKKKEPETNEEPMTEEPAEMPEETEPEKASEEEQVKGAVAEKTEAKEEAPVSVEEKAPTPAEEKEKPSKKEKKEEEEEIVEERIYTVPLGKALIVPAIRRAPRAMRMLRAFITKHMKLEARKEAEGEEEEEPSRLIISNAVNLRIWNRGIGKPPRKIRVRAAKDKDGNVTVYLAEGD